VRERLRVSGLAIVASVVFFFIAGAFEADLMVTMGPDTDPETMSVLNVLFITFVAAMLAIGLAAVLDRFSTGRTIWTAIASLVFLGSFSLLAQFDLGTGDLIWQALLHSVFGLLLIIGFYVGWPDQTS